MGWNYDDDEAIFHFTSQLFMFRSNFNWNIYLSSVLLFGIIIINMLLSIYLTYWYLFFQMILLINISIKIRSKHNRAWAGGGLPAPYGGDCTPWFSDSLGPPDDGMICYPFSNAPILPFLGPQSPFFSSLAFVLEKNGGCK